MTLECRNCNYQSLDYLVDYDVFRCPKCHWQITGELLEIMNTAQPKNYGLFQIHESPLIPPGQIYLFSQKIIDEQQFLLSQDFIIGFLNKTFNEYKPKEKPFDYKERAAIEFDLSNESGLQ